MFVGKISDLTNKGVGTGVWLGSGAKAPQVFKSSLFTVENEKCCSDCIFASMIFDLRLHLSPPRQHLRGNFLVAIFILEVPLETASSPTF
jgi:hypothetical protein